MRNIAELISTVTKKQIAKLDFADTATIIKVHYTTGTALIELHDGYQNQVDNVPIVMPTANNNYGFICFPKKGDHVVILYLEKDKHAPVILGSLFVDNLFDNTEGDWTIKHPSGSYIKFKEDGSIIIHPLDGKKVKVT